MAHSDLTVHDVIRFSSFAALRQAHTELLEYRHLHGDSLEVQSRIAAFIERGMATGALIDVRDERRASQNLLDYWSNVLYRVGVDIPDATLDEFNPELAPLLDDTSCPYLGLDAFREDNHPIFFGRTHLIESIVERLKEQRFLALIGSSGSGKSSVIRAGLIPALKSDALPGSQDWHYQPPIVPTSDPLAALAWLIKPEGERINDWIHDQIDAFRQDASHLTKQLTRRDTTPVVLVIDQFEELFTLCNDENARKAFIDNLLHLVHSPDGRHILIITMRSDFETFIARIPELQMLFEQFQVRITPMSAVELREAIEKPAELVGLKFETGVVDTLIQEILGEPAALPLLQFTLLKLWDNRTRNRVTWKAYQQVGGGRQALARSADAFYAGLIPEDQVTARRILLRIVRPGEGLEITSNRIRREMLYQTGEDRDRIDRVLDKLIQSRLIRVTVGDEPADVQVEVAHEALVRNWPMLVNWLEEERVTINTRRQLEIKAAEWVRLGQGSGGLLDKIQLGEAERWLDSSEAAYLGYDGHLPLLVKASRMALDAAAQEEEAEAARQRELEQIRTLATEQQRRAEEQARAARYLRWLIVVLVIATLATTGLAFLASRERAASLSLANAGNALSAIDGRPEQAMLLALAALPRGTTIYGPEVTRALYRVFDEVNKRRILKSEQPVISAVWVKDGTQVSTISEDGSVRVWDVAEGKELRRLPGQSAGDQAVAFSPDRSKVFIGKTGQIVDLKTGKEVQVLETGSDDAYTVAWRPDSRQVAIGDRDGTVHIVDVEAGKELHVLKAKTPSDSIFIIVWHPDGQRLLIGSKSSTARIWNTATGEVLPLSGHAAGIRAVAWNKSGSRVVTGSDDKTARIWDAESGKTLHELIGHSASIYLIQWSPDDQKILTGSDDLTTRIWDAKTGELLFQLKGHIAPIRAMAWSPMGNRIITGSMDTTARIWDATTGASLQILRGHKGWVSSVAWHPTNEDRVLTGSADGTARMWDLSPSTLIRELPGTVSINAMAWGIDSRHLLVGGENTDPELGSQGIAQIWDTEVGRIIHTLSGHTKPITSVAWRGDGLQIVTGSRDKTAKIWDATTGVALRTLAHKDDVNAVDWAPNGREVLTGGGKKGVQIWDATTGKLVATFGENQGILLSAAWSPDERFIATGYGDTTGQGDNAVRIWDVTTRKEIHSLTGHTSYVYRMAWSPDGKRLLTGSADATARVWDAVTGQELQTLIGHEGWIWSVAWSPDGNQVLTGSEDGTARVWDVATGNELRTLRTNTGPIYAVTWSPNGQEVFTSSTDGTVRGWMTSTDLIAAEITRRVCDLFTDDQIHAYIGSWRGCNIELAAVDTNLQTYNTLQHLKEAKLDDVNDNKSPRPTPCYDYGCHVFSVPR